MKVHGGGNYWLSCLLIDEDAMATAVRGERTYVYRSEKGKSSPDELLDVLRANNAEGRPIWKPLHLQPMYRENEFITVSGRVRGNSDAYIDHGASREVTTVIFNRGLCLPSDNKMTDDQLTEITALVHGTFTE